MSHKVVAKHDVTNSSMIKSIARTETNDLVVEFTKGQQYLYKGAGNQFVEMQKAESAGKFLKAEVEKKFPYEKLELPLDLTVTT